MSILAECPTFDFETCGARHLADAPETPANRAGGFSTAGEKNHLVETPLCGTPHSRGNCACAIAGAWFRFAPAARRGLPYLV